MNNVNQTKNRLLLAGILAATGAVPLNLSQSPKRPSDKVEFTEEEQKWLSSLHKKARKLAIEQLKAKHWAKRR